MKIFVKNIPETGAELFNYNHVQGFIFSISQLNAERVKEIINKIPFYMPIIGEIKATKRFEIEELIFFYKLSGIIISDELEKTSFSCPKILTSDFNKYNVFFKDNNLYKTDYLAYEEIVSRREQIDGLILPYHEIEKWQQIISGPKVG